MATSSAATELWETIAGEAARESRALGARRCARTASASAEPSSRRSATARFALGLETIYEGYLLHYGRPRLFAPADADTALLLGDYLYAHGLVRVADAGDGRRGRRPRRADLALRAAARRARRAATAPPGRRRPRCSASGRLEDARAALRTASDAGPLERLAREAAATRRSSGALAAHAGRVE